MTRNGNHRTPRLAIVLVALVGVALLAGCLGSDDGARPAGEEGADAGETSAGGSPGEAPAGGSGTGDPVTFERTYDGFLVYRTVGDSGPFIREQGNSTTFCFGMPANTTRLDAHLTWTPPEQMGLEFYGPESTTRSWSFQDPSSLYQLPPIEMHLEDPHPGTWRAYAGPGAMGVAIDWTLTLEWTVDRADASVAETFYHGDPCN